MTSRFESLVYRRLRLAGCQAFPVIAFLVLVVGIATPTAVVAADEAAATVRTSNAAGVEAAEARLSATVQLLASDEFEGRGIGTKGLDLAAQYIAEQFERLGLKTDLYDGRPFQSFAITTGAVLGEKNELSLVGPPGENSEAGQLIKLALGEDFTPLAIGGSGTMDLPLAFVGYGITGKDEGYDDYEGVDVEGKAVIILRHEPQQANPHSVFNGTQHSTHAPFVRKVANAYEHGAAAIVFCTDEFEIRKNVGRRLRRWNSTIEDLAEEHARFQGAENPALDEIKTHQQRVEKLLESIHNESEKLASEYDPLLAFTAAGRGQQGRRFPVLQMRRATLDRILKQSAGKNLAALERAIDEGPTPHSLELPEWRLRGEINVLRNEAEVKNVVAVLDGEGPLALETVVIGAHYDHLGYGGAGSLTPSRDEIHNGADDNASGIAALIEVARRLAMREEPLKRRVVFIAFTAEERGLIGSARYVRDPAVPLDQTIAMLNMDMVGRLKDDKLIVHGTATAPELDALVERFNEQYGFQIAKQPGGFGPSDHSSFYAKHVPVLHFFTGTHRDYHRPSDDFEKVNFVGIRRIAEMVADIAVGLTEADGRPQYQATANTMRDRASGDRPYFGSIPDFSQDQPGYVITGVTKDGPAERAGLRGGDAIIQFGDSKIDGLEDFDSALRKYKSGDKVKVVVRRDDEELKLDVTLEDPR